MSIKERLGDGRLWMRFWVATGVAMGLWGLLTCIFWLDSVRNLNIMTVVGLWIATAAGFQATLSMRKADPKDEL